MGLINMNAKDKICHSAIQLFVEKGYHATSIPDIVNAAEVSTGALYHHFKSKEELAKYMHEKVTCKFIEKYTTRVKVLEKFEDKIKEFVKMMFEWHKEKPYVVKYLTTSRPHEILNRRTTICSEEGIKVIGEMISSGLSSLELSISDYFLAAAVISGTIIQYINLKNDGYVEKDLVDMSDDVAKVIFKALSKR